MITTAEFYDYYLPQVQRAARREHKQTLLFSIEDLEQEIWVALLPHHERLHKQGEAYIYTAAQTAARRYAERERIDNMYFRGSFIYTPDMVRTELEAGAWIGDITGDWDLRMDIRQAFDSLTEREQQLLFSKYMMGVAPRPGGEKTALYRAVDKMTHYLNGQSGMSAVDLEDAAEAA